MKKISILGSTGSIGVNALSVIKNFPENFRVIHLTGNLNSEKMIEQGKEFLPNSITMIDEQAAEKVKSGLIMNKLIKYICYIFNHHDMYYLLLRN